ncbi:MAG: argininosuccinate synthase [Thermoflexales bacterium]|nr:argininosuccinate synthase [Thermoflexales bacterium]MCS7325438.1 argininosuccinate synthase [Thermoflexales bacterium]MCX7938279.1 argininosuccinate synthase [Thermoflexales bacterium]MDW8054045.1 argininosuccinate synthase [Anaerolineae bacterium]MDW8292620.1 argininosuccinate synthase [Anaerolineae bacterium]
MSVRIRPAVHDDVPAIAALIAHNARKGGLLPRSEANIRAHLGNFLVAEDNTGRVVGCGSLLPMNTTLVELRSLAVDESARGGGVGQKLVAALVEEARRRQFGTIFALTRAVRFFEKCGFSVAPKEFFPEKVWSDCVQCPMLENCDEVAVMMPLQPEQAPIINAQVRNEVLAAVRAGRIARRAVSRENRIPLETVTRLSAAPAAHADRAAPREVRKVVLAYTGGLDSSACIPWLIEHYGCEVICFLADIGQREDFEALRQKALRIGASRVIIRDLREEFANEYLFPLIQSGAIYEHKYLLGSSISRPLIAKHQVDVAMQEGADAVAHGSTGKGNDQVRFELSYMALNPNLRVIAPWREWHFKGRRDVYEYARSRGVPLGDFNDDLYTLDENLWHFNHEGGKLEDLEYEPEEHLWKWTNAVEETPDAPEYVEIEFLNGIPKRLNGEALSGAQLIERLNEIGALHGVGRVDIVENRLVGIKSRALDEAPAATILRAAHQGLEEITLDRETMHFKQIVALKFADLVYNGQWFTPLRDALQAFITVTQRDVTGSVRVRLFKGNVMVVQRKATYSLYREDLATFNNDEAYDQRSADGFIRLFGLPMRVKAQLDQRRAQHKPPPPMTPGSGRE